MNLRFRTSFPSSLIARYVRKSSHTHRESTQVTHPASLNTGDMIEVKIFMISEVSDSIH